MFEFETSGSYTGIGSRRINAYISRVIMELSCCLSLKGIRLRSGGADGSDTSFETGARIAYDALSERYGFPPGDYQRAMIIYLPWNNFSGRHIGSGYTDFCSPDAHILTSSFHKGWANLSDPVRTLMARNAQQVLGENLNSPARFVFCYTADGAETNEQTSHKTGGTGQAIRIASSRGIKVHNIGNPATLKRTLDWIQKTSEQCIAMHGLDPRALVERFLAQHNGIQCTRQGNFIELALAGEFDVIINESSCQNDMKEGPHAALAIGFPTAITADMQTKKGARSKLGTCSVAEATARNGRKVTIINAYTQYKWGADEALHVDYEAVRKSIQVVGRAYGKKGTIAFPRIGTGSGNGCWVTISNTIRHELRNTNHCLINHDGSLAPAPTPRPRQGSLDLDI